jgi:(2R)-ethylmalonyl-CoA mutase
MARDNPWIFRTYAGHSSARASNELYRRNLAAGQTGLSIAFDLPTQCGYDSDHPLARPEVGKVGVPIASLDDMHTLFDGIPIEQNWTVFNSILSRGFRQFHRLLIWEIR